MTRNWKRVAASIAVATGSLIADETRAADLGFWVDPGGWPDTARRDAAVWSAGVVAAEYSRYGDFTWGNPGYFDVVYGSGTPTADAGYGGWGGRLRFGGSWPSLYVMIHELNHWLGSGTYSNAMGLSHNGPRSNAIMEQFDGVGARLGTDGVHIYQYGHNQGYEYSPINFRRNVALMYALRGDWGIGPADFPATAKAVHLRASDPVGESGFNFPWNWSNDRFAQPGTDYFTGNFAMRTPQGYPSWDFRGDSLTVNNKNNPNGGLLFNGWGTTGAVTIKNLILDGGTVKHDQFSQDLFQLDGKITVVSPSKLIPANGSVDVLSDITGLSTLTIADSDGGHRVRFLSEDNTFKGNIDVQGRFELVDNADLRFVIKGNGVNNMLFGSGADSVLLDGDFVFDTTAADISSGNFWSIVTSANTTYGSNFSVAGYAETSPGVWMDSSGFIFRESTGQLVHNPEPASLAVIALAGAGLLRPRRKA